MVFRPVHSAEESVGTTRKPTLKAVIFDLDGVVADSHPIHEMAWTNLLVEQGLDRAALNLDFLYAGHSRREILTHYLGAISANEMERLGRRKDELYTLEAQSLLPKPRIPEVLNQLNEDGILCALATSAGRGRTYDTIEKFGILEKFTAIVTGDQPDMPKPAPDIFLVAALKLGVSPKCCVVVEDSVAGVVAARAAGMKCVGFAPVKRFGELAEAGANDLISELPEDAAGYFSGLLTAGNEEPAAGARI